MWTLPKRNQKKTRSRTRFEHCLPVFAANSTHSLITTLLHGLSPMKPISKPSPRHPPLLWKKSFPYTSVLREVLLLKKYTHQGRDAKVCFEQILKWTRSIANEHAMPRKPHAVNRGKRHSRTRSSSPGYNPVLVLVIHTKNARCVKSYKLLDLVERSLLERKIPMTTMEPVVNSSNACKRKLHKILRMVVIMLLLETRKKGEQMGRSQVSMCFNWCSIQQRHSQKRISIKKTHKTKNHS
mmetsp:Transcript_24807/g.35362  ORF Transcript_24807/g.35362 Transcript_24807/m.35362 type:complete len:239 (+) Transcript_24807:510-1226(+)